MSLTRRLRVSRVDVRLKKASLLTLTALVRLAPAKLGAADWFSHPKIVFRMGSMKMIC